MGAAAWDALAPRCQHHAVLPSKHRQLAPGYVPALPGARSWPCCALAVLPQIGAANVARLAHPDRSASYCSVFLTVRLVEQQHRGLIQIQHVKACSSVRVHSLLCQG